MKSVKTRLPALIPVDVESLVARLQNDPILATLPPEVRERITWLGTVAKNHHAHLQARSLDRDVHRIAEDRGDWMNPRGPYVYLLWGANRDAPLYVGQSRNILARVGHHMQNKKKFSRVRRVQIVLCRDKGHMLILERELIEQYLPPWNIRGTGRPFATTRA